MSAPHAPAGGLEGAARRDARPAQRPLLDAGCRALDVAGRRSCSCSWPRCSRLIALAVKLDSAGPALFRQRRLGTRAQAVHGPQVPHDGPRRRRGPAPRVRHRAHQAGETPEDAPGPRYKMTDDTARDPLRARSAPLEPRRAAAAVERAARRDVAGRARDRRSPTRSSSTRRTGSPASRSSPGSPACGRSAAAPT